MVLHILSGLGAPQAGLRSL